MPLDDKQLQRFQAHLKKHGVRGSALCPICHGQSWTATGLSAIPASDGNHMLLGGATMPIVQLVCNTCYYIRTFAWLPIAGDESADG